MDDLTFWEDDILYIISKGPNGWWIGELDGKVGRIPSNYVEGKLPSPSHLLASELLDPVIKCRALEDFHSTKAKDLNFKENQILLIIDRPDDDWWIGELDGRTGT